MKIRDDAVTIPGKVSRSLGSGSIENSWPMVGSHCERNGWRKISHHPNTCGYRMDCS